MMSSHYDGGPAYPQTVSFPPDGSRFVPWEYGHGGMSLRVWLATHAPAPSESDIRSECDMDKRKNPYNEAHKPRPRSLREVEADLRYRWADAMIARENIYEER